MLETVIKNKIKSQPYPIALGCGRCAYPLFEITIRYVKKKTIGPLDRVWSFGKRHQMVMTFQSVFKISVSGCPIYLTSIPMASRRSLTPCISAQALQA